MAAITPKPGAFGVFIADPPAPKLVSYHRRSLRNRYRYIQKQMEIQPVKDGQLSGIHTSHRTAMLRLLIPAIAAFLAVTTLLSAKAVAADQAASKGEAFLTNVAPLLKSHCIRCHGG